MMAGGTGGHVFPALAVAERLQAKGWEVHWLGSEKGMEASIIPKTKIPLHLISIQGLRRKDFLTKVLVPFQLIRALYQSLRVMAKLKPELVLGMGGFVTGPGGIAAWLTRRPLIIHEQNAIVGMTNRWLAKFASQVLEAFPGAFTPNAKAICTGNPVREVLLSLEKPRERLQNRQGPLRLLILGGSRGAEALNTLCPEAIQVLKPAERPEIWHQAGEAQADITIKSYQKAEVLARVDPFIEDMAKAYGWADLVVCRAGALTIEELASVGVASILVPYPFAVDDHQTYNGRFLEKQGAAKLIQQSALSPQALANILLELSADRDRLLKMAEAAFGVASRDALNKVTRVCEEAVNEYVQK